MRILHTRQVQSVRHVLPAALLLALAACSRNKPQVVTPVRVDTARVVVEPSNSSNVRSYLTVNDDPFHRIDHMDWPGPNRFRAADGEPGPDYWQQRADYSITATLDTTARSIAGAVTIKYVNNSPDTLRFVWLQVDQNLYKPGSKGSVINPADSRWGARNFQGGYVIDKLTVDGKSVQSRVDDTMMRVDLEKPIAPRGGTATIAMSFSFRVPDHGSDRMGRDSTLYEIAQWFPRMAVYDDVRGWNTDAGFPLGRREHRTDRRQRQGRALSGVLRLATGGTRLGGRSGEYAVDHPHLLIALLRTPKTSAWPAMLANWKTIQGQGVSVPLMTPPDRIDRTALGALGYRKPAVVLLTLRNHVVGRDMFDRAFREYTRRWAFKHPTPADFFRTVENVTGADLSWYWRAFFYTNDVLDLGVDGVTNATTDGQIVASIAVRRHTSIPFPIIMRLRLADGSTQEVTIPVEIWNGNQRVTAEVPVRSNVIGVRLWPDGTVPDWNDSNDAWGNAPAADTPALVTTGGLNTSVPRK